MNWAITRNSRVLNLDEIPVLDIQALRSEIIKECRNYKRVVAFFGLKKREGVLLFTVLADDENSRLLVSSAMFKSERSYPAITPEMPSLHMFEREFFEEFGIKPEGHPWLKPVRYSSDRFDKTQTMENYPFFKIEGDEIHEVAVGPVHAGIIEPGHFRFSCHGENLYHLEIQLGYQHRGVEKLFLGKNTRFFPHIAESIAGDSVIAHTTVCARALEELENIDISLRSQSIRAIALELERIAVHLGDLSALANDVAYLMGSSFFGTIRTLAINTTLALCGSRFGRGFIRPGGVLFDLDMESTAVIRKNLKDIYRNTGLMAEAMFSSAGVLSRFEQTGVLSEDIARDIGMVGLAARASGVPVDVRTDHPYGIYRNFPFHKITLNSGDVFARAYIRYVEIKQSIQYIIEQLDNIPGYKPLKTAVRKIKPDSLVVSLTEGWRGEVSHSLITGKDGNFLRYKIKDPSFNNWYGLALAMRNGAISDFPLCNKSFNLSYCGFDL